MSSYNTEIVPTHDNELQGRGQSTSYSPNPQKPRTSPTSTGEELTATQWGITPGTCTREIKPFSRTTIVL